MFVEQTFSLSHFFLAHHCFTLTADGRDRTESPPGLDVQLSQAVFARAPSTTATSTATSAVTSSTSAAPESLTEPPATARAGPSGPEIAATAAPTSYTTSYTTSTFDADLGETQLIGW